MAKEQNESESTREGIPKMTKNKGWKDDAQSTMCTGEHVRAYIRCHFSNDY